MSFRVVAVSIRTYKKKEKKKKMKIQFILKRSFEIRHHFNLSIKALGLLANQSHRGEIFSL